MNKVVFTKKIFRWILSLPILIIGFPFFFFSELLFSYPSEGKFIQNEYWNAWIGKYS